MQCVNCFFLYFRPDDLCLSLTQDCESLNINHGTSFIKWIYCIARATVPQAVAEVPSHSGFFSSRRDLNVR